MSLQFSSGVLNQLGAPAIYEDLIANRPAAGYKGRVFIGTDNFNIYRDNGTTWNQLGGSASGTVTSIIGTANQVIASSSTGAVTLSLPQSIGISNSPTFTGLTLSGLSAAGVVVNNGSGVIATAAGTGFLKMAAGVISFDNSAYITLASLSANTPLSYNSGTGAFSIQVANTSQNGYLSSADWNTFNGKMSAITLTVTGSSGSATLVGSTLNIPTYTLAGLGGISLSSLSATSPLAYNSGTGAFSIQVANTSQSGYLSSADWNTFNGKQAAINGTGFVKASGTTLSYDNSTYLTTAVAASTYLPLAGGTLTGALSGTSASFSGLVTSTNSTGFQTTPATNTSNAMSKWTNATGSFYVGIDNSTGSVFGNGVYNTNIYTDNATSIILSTNARAALTINSSQAATFASNVTATLFSHNNMAISTADQLIGSGSSNDAALNVNGGGNSIIFGVNNVSKVSINASALNVLPTTASTSYTTGSLIVSGGVGIAGNLFVGNIQLNASNNMVYSSALSPAGYNYTATTALNTPAFYYGYTGGGTATFTVPNPSLNNQLFFIKNVSGTVLTVQAFSGYDIITAAGATVSSFTLATGIGALLYSNGGTHTLQIS